MFKSSHLSNEVSYTVGAFPKNRSNFIGWKSLCCFVKPITNNPTVFPANNTTKTTNHVGNEIFINFPENFTNKNDVADILHAHEIKFNSIFDEFFRFQKT